MSNCLEFSKLREFKLMLTDTKKISQFLFTFYPKSTTAIDCLWCFWEKSKSC